MTENTQAETPATTIRRAATRMRELAALVPPEPWYPAVHDVTTHDGLDVIASSGLTVRAQYVASWHPGVALAVADWLDTAAQAWDAGVEWDEALDLARRYLGETDAHLRHAGAAAPCEATP